MVQRCSNPDLIRSKMKISGPTYNKRHTWPGVLEKEILLEKKVVPTRVYQQNAMSLMLLLFILRPPNLFVTILLLFIVIAPEG